MADTDRIFKEKRFAQLLEDVRRLAREQGNTISSEQLQKAFAELSLSDAQLSHVHTYLKASHIGVDEAPDLDAALTADERDYLAEYMETVKAIPQLSAREKEALYVQARTGDKDAQHRLIEANLTTVVDIARLYADQGVFLEDLIGQGNVALTKGVTMLDAVETAKEASELLAKFVMDAMETLIAETFAEKERENRALSKVNTVAEKAAELAADLRRKVTVEELSEESGLSEEEIREAVRISGNQIEDIDA